MRDRLIELMREAELAHLEETIIRPHTISSNEFLADYLLENGVIVTPCKAGARIYAVISRTSDNRNLYIIEDEITHYRIVEGCTIMCLKEHLGLPDYKWKNVFLTREEAEQALKGGKE